MILQGPAVKEESPSNSTLHWHLMNKEMHFIAWLHHRGLIHRDDSWEGKRLGKVPLKRAIAAEIVQNYSNKPQQQSECGGLWRLVQDMIRNQRCLEGLPQERYQGKLTGTSAACITSGA